MKRATQMFLALGVVLLFAAAGPATASDGWRTLTPPQPLPAPESTGNVEVNGGQHSLRALRLRQRRDGPAAARRPGRG